MKKHLIIVLVLGLMIFTGCKDSENIPGVKSVLNPEIKLDENYTVEELKISKDKIKSPYGVCWFNNSIVVCDYSGHKLVLLNQDGEYQSSFGSIGSGNGEFLNPTGITVHDNCLYVLDSGNNRVQVFDSEYKYLKEIKLNILVHKQAGFSYTDIAIDNDGVIYVTTDSIGNEDAYIYILKDGKILKSKNAFVGFLAEYDGNIYAANTLELVHTPKQDTGKSGKNALSLLNNGNFKKVMDLPEGYMPLDFLVTDNNYFIISEAVGILYSFSSDGEYTGSVCDFDEYSGAMYMSDINSEFYIVTNTGNKKIFFIKKIAME